MLSTFILQLHTAGGFLYTIKFPEYGSIPGIFMQLSEKGSVQYHFITMAYRPSGLSFLLNHGFRQAPELLKL